MQETMTTVQIAKLLSVSTRTIRNYARDNKIPGAFKLDRHWRFDSREVNEWIESKKHQQLFQDSDTTGD